MADEDTQVGYWVGDRYVNGWGQDIDAPSEDASVDYSKLKGDQLVAEIERRNADRDEADQIVLDDRKKSTAVAALKADDEAHAEEE